MSMADLGWTTAGGGEAWSETMSKEEKKEEKKRQIRQRMLEQIEAQREEARRVREEKEQDKAERDKAEEAVHAEAVESVEQELTRLAAVNRWDVGEAEYKRSRERIRELEREKRLHMEKAVGRKLFIGKLSHADLDEKYAKNPPLLRTYKRHRVKAVQDLFGEFGEVEEITWTKNAVFVTFAEAKAAETCLEVLGYYPNRLERVKAIRKAQKQRNIPSIVAPSPSFYPRWPKNVVILHQREEARKKNLLSQGIHPV
eukprot:CAMPEP_0119135038 /NCGR_PEP_ID=MMETSP1310-20130426/18523_1 /TAXON_ID=464262 /ORGANISM="Genus nov. species nov., Strain RCC2339" /LENGTH=255 /DNA_ID=CAMNT_0007125891 /DNA_START=167 /DNA_END=934 /DNA_ORIENTATION=-